MSSGYYFSIIKVLILQIMSQKMLLFVVVHIRNETSII